MQKYLLRRYVTVTVSEQRLRRQFRVHAELRAQRRPVARLVHDLTAQSGLRNAVVVDKVRRAALYPECTGTHVMRVGGVFSL